MKRLLCITAALNAGGAETFLMKLHRNIDREKYQMDFCVMSDETGVYDEEVISRGGKIFHAAQKSKNPIKCFLDIRRIVKENDYKYVMRVHEHSLASLDLIAARMGGAEIIAMRSTIAGTLSKLFYFLHKAFQFLPKLVPNVKLAPSTEAAEYTFGKGCIQRKKAHLLHNGLEHDTYKFNKESRALLREQLGLGDCLAVGHVGRFSPQKNHRFLIDVFKSISDKNENARLVLVGVGELESQIKEKVHNLGLDEKVLLLGRRSDVPQLMSVFDVMLLPSFCEGMPNVIIEAQASGLPCVIADTITPEADITGLVKYLSLECSAEEWADAVLENASIERRDTLQDFNYAGYELSQVIDNFIELIFEGAAK